MAFVVPFSIQVYPSSASIQPGQTTDIVISATNSSGSWGVSVTTALLFDSIVSGAVAGGLGINSSSAYRSTGSGPIILRYRALSSQSGAVNVRVRGETINLTSQTTGTNYWRFDANTTVTVQAAPENAPLPQPTGFALVARTDLVPDRFLKAKGSWAAITPTYSYIEVETKDSDGISTVQDNYKLTNLASSGSPFNNNFHFPDFETAYRVRIRFVRESTGETGAWSATVTYTTEDEIATIGNVSSVAAVASIDQPEIRLTITVPRLVLPITDPRYNLYYLSANIYRSTTIGGTYTLLPAGTAVSSIGNTSPTIFFVDTEVAFDTEYFYKVKSCLPGATTQESASFSSIVNATTIPEPGPPDAPVLTLNVDSYKQITLSWDTFPTNTTFIVRRALAAGGPYSNVADVPAGSTSYIDSTLSPSTTYHYKITAKNAFGNADSNIVSATTDIAPDAPPAPTGLIGTALGATKVRLTWVAGTLPVTANPSGNAPEYFDIYRGLTTTGPYDLVASVSPENTAYTDGSVAPLTTYYYVVKERNAGGSSSASNEVEVTTPDRSVTLLQDLGFTFTVGAMTKIIQVAGRLLFWSSLNRAVAWINRRSYLAGLKQQLTAPAVSAGSAAGLTGTFEAYIVLYRSDGGTPSRPSPASAEQVLADQKLVVTPLVDPLDASKIYVPDIGYDSSGEQISGCDFYDVYIRDVNGAQGVPNYVATVPITTVSYTTDATLDATKLARGKPMVDYENLPPPACGIACYSPTTNRVMASGETTMKPTSDEVAAGAALQISQGNKYCTVTGWDSADDALMHKEMRLNRATTGWFVEYVDTSVTPTKIYLRNPDALKHAVGFAGANGPYSDFAFSGNPGRVYRSAFFSQGDVEVAFQPETYPPGNVIEGQLNPDDNQNPNGMIPSRDVLLVTKPNSCFVLRGGAGTDEDAINGSPVVANVSRGSGLLAPKTFCTDRFDVAYGLNDQGPFRLDETGPTNVGVVAGVAWLLQKYYDIATADGAVGCFFSREDYVVFCGLNRKGRAGNRDWFLYDTRNNAVLMQTFPSRITALLPTPTDSGETQLLYGDEGGNLGTLLTTGLRVDGINYTMSNPTDGEVPVQCSINTGVVCPTYGFSPDKLRPHIRIDDLTEDVQFVFEYDSLNRSGQGGQFVASKTNPFTISPIRNPDHIPLKRRECQSARFRLSFVAPRNSDLRIANMELEAVEHGI